MEAVRHGERVFTIAAGAPVNFRDVAFNPHGHGTHTESVGHITADIRSVGALLQRYFFTAEVISVRPSERRHPDGSIDRVITLGHFREAIGDRIPEALVLRTLPNTLEKRTRDWTGTNPPYLEDQACAWLRSIGVKHLLLDLPSVDREHDEGRLAAHHAFWNVDAQGRPLDGSPDGGGRTITEMIFVPDAVRDGAYLLELQLPHFMNDAAPSRPVLYAILP